MHGFESNEDDEGWTLAACVCGWTGGPFPGIEDAADWYGDHCYAAGAKDTLDELSRVAEAVRGS